ncbi:MAG TPA: carboxypeptidase-like regulatory domain-containing protein [Lentzea sp.]
MSRLLRSAAAGMLTVVLCLGVSTGPVLADDRRPVDPAATVMSGPTETAPAETAPSQPSPTETAPAEPEPTTPEPTETKPAETGSSAPTTTTPITSASSSATPPVAPVAELADLQLRVWFDRPSYQRPDLVTVRASVTNAGAAIATQVIVNSTGNLTDDEWYPFWPNGVTVLPGETVEGILSGFVSNDEDAVRLVVTAAQRGGEQDANPDDNTVSASVPVLTWPGSYRGTVFGDRDGDRVMDPGEGLPGIQLMIEGGSPQIRRWATTDANGAFAFHDLLPGSYTTSLSSDGWYLTQPPVDVDGVDDPNVLIRGVPRLHGRLTASAAFTQQSYREGDLARAILTLHNTSDLVLTDLIARCQVPQYPNRSIDADAGELSPDGPGAVLPAGATREFAVTAPVTSTSAWSGHIRLQCWVEGRTSDSYGQVIALAHVAGGVAPKVIGTLWQVKSRYKWYYIADPLPGVKIYLRDQVDGRVVARDVTGSAGNFTFLDVPAGLYNFRVVGPWQIVPTVWQDHDGSEVIVLPGEAGLGQHVVYVVPGPYQADPDPAPPAGPAPQPETGEPPLAATGTGVTRLALGGLLTLLVGAGLVLIARRPNGPGSRRT